MSLKKISIEFICNPHQSGLPPYHFFTFIAPWTREEKANGVPFIPFCLPEGLTDDGPENTMKISLASLNNRKHHENLVGLSLNNLEQLISTPKHQFQYS
jgi:hypothetical protein